MRFHIGQKVTDNWIFIHWKLCTKDWIEKQEIQVEKIYAEVVTFEAV